MKGIDLFLVIVCELSLASIAVAAVVTNLGAPIWKNVVLVVLTLILMVFFWYLSKLVYYLRDRSVDFVIKRMER